jgi:hypothetical protein
VSLAGSPARDSAVGSDGAPLDFARFVDIAGRRHVAVRAWLPLDMLGHALALTTVETGADIEYRSALCVAADSQSESSIRINASLSHPGIMPSARP